MYNTTNISTDLLKEHAKNVRLLILETLYNAQSGHPGAALSITEIIVDLIFREMNWMYEKNVSDRDRLILSKGHAVTALYASLVEAGFLPKEELKTFRKINSKLQGHPVRQHMPEFIHATTGALGQGLSVGLGMAKYLRQFNKKNRVYVILGDGEIQEGQIWEAVMSEGKFHDSNVVGIVDRNGMQNDDLVDNTMPLGDLQKKFESFGWHTITIDGHNFNDIQNAFKKARQVTERATMIIANTQKGRLGAGKIFMNGAHAPKNIPESDYLDAVNYLNGAVDG